MPLQHHHHHARQEGTPIRPRLEQLLPLFVRARPRHHAGKAQKLFGVLLRPERRLPGARGLFADAIFEKLVNLRVKQREALFVGLVGYLVLELGKGELALAWVDGFQLARHPGEHSAAVPDALALWHFECSNLGTRFRFGIVR